jgi:hypothetical protein
MGVTKPSQSRWCCGSQATDPFVSYSISYPPRGGAAQGVQLHRGVEHPSADHPPRAQTGFVPARSQGARLRRAAREHACSKPVCTRGGWSASGGSAPRGVDPPEAARTRGGYDNCFHRCYVFVLRFHSCEAAEMHNWGLQTTGLATPSGASRLHCLGLWWRSAPVEVQKRRRDALSVPRGRREARFVPPGDTEGP